MTKEIAAATKEPREESLISRKEGILKRADPRKVTVVDLAMTALEEANRLVFVKDLERACDFLADTIRSGVVDKELLFRFVEVAVRCGRIEQVEGVVDDLRLNENTRYLAQLTRCLLEIRRMEQSQQVDEDDLINPSLRSDDRTFASNFSRDADVIGLGERNMLAHHALPSRLSYLGLAGLESSRRGYVMGKNVRVTRSPLVADDFIAIDPNESSIEEFEKGRKSLENDASASGNEEMLSRIVAETDQLLLDYKEDYAAWYLRGCAAELEGNLTHAMDAWKHSYSLKPDSLAVLATLSELQQIGALSASDDIDYAEKFEGIDPYAVHGTYETHMRLYEEFLERGETRLAITALRTLGDWLQKQRGEVPVEIEILCLFGAMKAHRMEGNSGAAEASRRQAENLTVAFKKSQDSLPELAFVAARAEEFDLPSLARMCYFSILSSPHAKKDLVLRVAAHCVTQYASKALAECLRSAYRLHNGDAEIRFCQVLNSLALASVPVKAYLDRKNQIRDLLTSEELGEALSLLQDAQRESTEDAEVHYYLAEIFTRLQAEELALRHFEAMYALDPLNSESVLRYIQFLLKCKRYTESEDVARRLIESKHLPHDTQGEVYWAMSAAAFATEKIELAREQISKALRCDPWNLTFLALALRLQAPDSQPLGGSDQMDLEKLLSQFEDVVLTEPQLLPEGWFDRWIAKAQQLARVGYCEFAYLMSCAVFRDHWSDSRTADLMIRTGATYDTRLAAQRLMVLHRSYPDAPSFTQLAAVVAQMYGASGEWALVHEWSDITRKSGELSDDEQLRLFELEAYRLMFESRDLSRARVLFENVLDAYAQKGQTRDQIAVALGYVLVEQGEFKAGLEKMKNHLKPESGIVTLCLMVKALHRTDSLPSSRADFLTRLFSMSPENPLESKLLQDVHMLTGIDLPGAAVNLRC